MHDNQWFNNAMSPVRPQAFVNTNSDILLMDLRTIINKTLDTIIFVQKELEIVLCKMAAIPFKTQYMLL